MQEALLLFPAYLWLHISRIFKLLPESNIGGTECQKGSGIKETIRPKSDWNLNISWGDYGFFCRGVIIFFN